MKTSLSTGAATWARGVNCCALVTLIFWLPNLNAKRSSVGVLNVVIFMPSTSV